MLQLLDLCVSLLGVAVSTVLLAILFELVKGILVRLESIDCAQDVIVDGD